MKNNKDDLLGQDIDQRMKSEQQNVGKPHHEPEHGKRAQIIVALVIAVIVLMGVLYPIIW